MIVILSFTPGFSRVILHDIGGNRLKRFSDFSLALFTWLKPGVNETG